jgi:hypothetical protein
VSDAVTVNGNGRLLSWLPAIGIMVGIIAGIITYTSQIAQLSNSVTGIDARLASIERRLDSLNDVAGKNQNEVIAQAQALKEIETQFCSSDLVRNLMHANDMRQMAVLWKKVMGDSIPTDNAYYPMICNRAATGDR